MDITGIDAIRYGTADLADSHRYLTDLGLQEVEHGSAEGRFITMDKGQVELRGSSDTGLPSAVSDGPPIREVVWGVASQAALDKIGAELAKDRPVTRDPD